MELWEYPRPPNDTGIGIHWSAGYPLMVGLGRVRDFWLPELLGMGVKWVKLLHDGGEGLAELLLENDIMPVVRLYRPQPNPGVLSAKEIEYMERYLRLGVKYFEFNNEPELDVEWRGGQVPENALEVVARNAIRDMELILEKGGYPAVPALATGSKWDLVGKICELGGDYLFEGGVWQAIHNYAINHPLDYPYDEVNQKGAPVSPEEYERLASEIWDTQTAWGADTIEMVNERRRAGANPGATINEDPSAWRSYEFFDHMVRKHLGRSIPILSTENGIMVGDRADPRYPRVTPNLHKERTLEMCRIMMGTSTLYPPAPEYYFCTAFWLIANYHLGHYAAGWESQAWYSIRWPDGKLPIIDALKAEPKKSRPPIVKAKARNSVIEGRVLDDGAGRQVILRRGEVVLSTVRTGADGAYRFENLAGGRYTLTIAGTKVVKKGVVTDGRSRVRVDLSLRTDDSVVRGLVKHGARRKVFLRSQDRTFETIVAADGSFRFANLPAGNFTLEVEGTDLRQKDIVTDGRNTIVVNLALPRWAWSVSTRTIGGGTSIVRCSVAGRKNLPIRLYTPNWGGMAGQTGTKPEYGEFACEFAPLQEETYIVEPEGLGVQARFFLPKGTVATVEFKEEVEPGEEKVSVTVIEAEEIEEEKPLKEIEHYLLLRQPSRDRATFVAVARYAARFSPVVGTSLEEALKARHVTILGGLQAVSRQEEDSLRQAGIHVERISTKIPETLERLIDENHPFLGNGE